MRDVLVVLFWLWVLVALGVYSYRLYRRATQGPKSARTADGTGGAEGKGEGGLLGRFGKSVPPPLPEGPLEARLPQSLENVAPPAPDGQVVIPPGGPSEAATAARPHSQPEPDPAEVAHAPEMPRVITLAEALQGIRMPEDLLPLVQPGEPGLADGRRARFGGTGTNVPTVAVALGEELRRLGYAVDGLDTITSARAGLTATRDDVSVAATVHLDEDTGAVVVELNI